MTDPIDVKRHSEKTWFLQNLEKYSKFLIENVHDIISVIDLDGILLYQSPSVKEVLGYRQEELIGNQILGYIHPDDFLRIKKIIEEGIKNTGSIHIAAYRFKHSDGSWRVLESVGKAFVLDKSQEIIVVNSRDVTQGKNTQREMESKNEDLEKFKLAIENTSDQIIITDPKGIITYANKAAEVLTGYSLTEMIGKTPRLWVKQMPKDFYTALWDIIKNKKKSFAGEFVNRKKTGGEYPVEAKIFPILDEKGNVKFFVGVERDVSSQKKLADNLKRENEEIAKKVIKRTKELSEERIKLQSSISSLAIGFIMTDKNNNIVIINQTAKNILCSSSASPLATVQNCTLQHVEDELKGAVDLRAMINQSMSERRTLPPKELEFQNRYLKIIITPITELANILGCVILIDDITEARILDRSKDEFFSIASHELRTPLTAIRGNTSLIKQYYWDKLKDKDLQEMVDDIHSSSVRLIQIVNDFLDTSRLEQGKITFKKEVFDPVSVINTVTKETENIAIEKKLSLELNKPAEEVQVVGDADRVKEIITNLIGNAIKFTQNGKIIISLNKKGENLEIRVSDTGIGIPLKSQHLLFRKFQQAENNILTRDNTQGTGLGLYISKLIAHGMGGDVVLEKSEENKGSVFLFTLPIAIKEN